MASKHKCGKCGEKIEVVDGDLLIKGNLYVRGTLNVCKDADFGGNVTIRGTLTQGSGGGGGGSTGECRRLITDATITYMLANLCTTVGLDIAQSGRTVTIAIGDIRNASYLFVNLSSVTVTLRFQESGNTYPIPPGGTLVFSISGSGSIDAVVRTREESITLLSGGSFGSGGMLLANPLVSVSRGQTNILAETVERTVVIANNATCANNTTLASTITLRSGSVPELGTTFLNYSFCPIRLVAEAPFNFVGTDIINPRTSTTLTRSGTSYILTSSPLP